MAKPIRSRTVRLPYVITDRDRHGTPRTYGRRYGCSIRIREAKGTPAVVRAVANALERLERPTTPRTGIKGPTRDTFGWLAAHYTASPEFNGLNRISQRTRRNIIEACLQ